MLDSVRTDARYAARGLVRSPVFSITAILSLAIGVGGTAAIYSLVNALLLGTPPGIGHPERIVTVGRTTNGSGYDNFSYLTYADYRDRNSTLSSLAAIELEPRSLSLAGPNGGEAVAGGVVSGSFFRVLEARPALGRFFLDEEDRTPKTNAVAVLSHAFWRDRFNSDSGIVGKAIVLNTVPFTVIGVASEGFHGPNIVAPDLWVPMMATPWFGSSFESLTSSRRGAWITAIGRLKPDVGEAQAQADLATVHAQLTQAYPEAYENQGVTVRRLTIIPGDMNNMVGLAMLFLFALTGLVLIIAGTNVAGMLLARSSARRREIAVRLAIGASRARLVRQLVTESTVLFAVAGLAGALVARWMVDGLLLLLPPIPFKAAFAPVIDWRVVLFALAVSIVAGLIAGLAPALQSTKPALAPELRSDVGGVGRKQRLRASLLVTQMAFSMLLLVVAGLFARALVRAKAIDPGFDPKGVHIATLDLGLVNHTQATGSQFMDRLTSEAARLPGVESVALARMIALDGGGMGLGDFTVEGRPASANNASWDADWNIVSPSYFDVMRIQVVRGRGFTENDRESAPRVAILNETMAARIWPGEDPIGRTFTNGGRVLTVIGIARNSKYRSLGEDPRNFVYVPFAQNYIGTISMLVRSPEGMSQAAPLRQLLARLDAGLPILISRSMDEQASIGLFPQRVALWVASSLGGVALLLALIGIYGVTAYSVARRTREIGVRIALGSTRQGIMTMVVRQGMGLGLLGVGIGVGAALAAGQVIKSLLYGVPGSDPIALGVAAALLLGAALLASWIPARRASRVDPMVALRQE